MEEIVSALCSACFHMPPNSLKRCSEGIGNYVYIAEYTQKRYVVRCSTERNAYTGTVKWLNALAQLQVPVSQVLHWGRFQGYDYLILSYLEGKDIGIVYPQLSDSEKRAIAKELVQIQNKAARLKLEGIPEEWSWMSFIEEMLDRAEKRIIANGYFDKAKVRELRIQAEKMRHYFSEIEPIAYLDDISSKNLLIHKGKISGIIDVDWIGIGDPLTYVALTHMALLNLEYDTDYVTYLLEEMRITEMQRKAFFFYSLLYCVDFMGERGMCFMDKKVEVNQTIIDRLNHIYHILWNQWCDL